MRHVRVTLLLLAAAPALVRAQVGAQRDTTKKDTVTNRAPIGLAPVTVTATPSRPEEPASTVQVSARIIQQTPTSDPYDLLRQTAGVEVHLQGQGPGFASDASVRGFSSDHSTDLAMWVDGVPINEPVNGHAEGYNDWSLLFPEAIQDLDVVKGPTSPVYGNFAMAGVVNVRTLERIDRTSAWVEPGSYGRVEGGLLTGYDRGTSSGVLGFRGEREDGWRPNSDYSLGQVHGRLVSSLSSKTTLDFGAELYGTTWHSPGFLSDSQFDAHEYDIVQNASDGGFKRRAQERASVRVLLGPTLLWRSTAYSTQGRWQLFLTIPPEPGSGEGTGSQTEEEDSRYGFGLTSALTWALTRGEITVGIEGRWDHSRYENWLTTLRARDSAQTLVTASQGSAALFVQTATDLSTRLRLLIGARIDGQGTNSTPDSAAELSASKSIVSPKFGMLFRLPDSLGLYGNVSKGFRQTDGVIEDPTLPFITEWAYEAGIKLNRPWVQGSIALFRMDVSNEQTFDPITLTSTSGGASRRQGVEVTANVRATRVVSVNFDWTFNDARYRESITEDGDTLTGLRVYNTSRYVGATALDLTPPDGRWSVRLTSIAAGPYSPFDEPGVIRPAYALFHVNGMIRFGPARLQLGVRNIFDTAYRELEAGEFVSPGQPRTVYGSVRYAL